MTDTQRFRVQRRSGPLDECEQLALDRVRSVHPRPMLTRDLIKPTVGASAAELNLGALRLQARGLLRARKQLAVELTKRVDKGVLAEAAAQSAIGRARGKSPKAPHLTVAEVVYALGRYALHQPTRTAAQMLSAPSPFEMLLALAEAGGFSRAGELIRVIGRPDTARAYALASEAASSIDPVAARAVLKYHGLEAMLPPLAQPTGKGQR